MEVLIGIVLFLVLGVIIVLVSRDVDKKIKDVANSLSYDVDGLKAVLLFGDEKNVGLIGLKGTVDSLSFDLGKLTKRVEALETGKVNAGDVNTTVGVAINLVKEELKKEIAKKGDKTDLDTISTGVKSLEDKVAGVVETLAAAAKEARHKAGIFEPYELVAKELEISEDAAQSLILSVDNDQEFGSLAFKAGIKLTDLASAQATVREIIAKASQDKVEAKEKTG